MPDTNLRPYKVGNPPSLPDSDRRYLADELLRISQSIGTVVEALTSIGTVVEALTSIGTVVEAITSPWVAYTPTVSVTSGAGTATGRYKQIGKTVHLGIDLTITTGGTWPIVSLPTGMVAVGRAMILGREILVIGHTAVGHVEGAQAAMVKYDGSATFTAGHQYIFSGTFEVA